MRPPPPPNFNVAGGEPLTEQESAPSLSTRATLKLGGCGGCLPREDAPMACASNLPFHMWPMLDARRCPTIAAWRRYDFTAFNDFDDFNNFNDANDFNNFNDPNSPTSNSTASTTSTTLTSSLLQLLQLLQRLPRLQRLQRLQRLPVHGLTMGLLWANLWANPFCLVFARMCQTTGVLVNPR